MAGQRLDGRKNVQYKFYNNHINLSAALTQVQCGLVVCVMDEQTEECRVVSAADVYQPQAHAHHLTRFAHTP